MNFNYDFVPFLQMQPMHLNIDSDSAHGESVSDASSSVSEAGTYYTNAGAHASYYNVMPVLIPVAAPQPTAECVNYDSGLQAKNLDYRREIIDLRDKLAKAENRITYLEQQVETMSSLERAVTTESVIKDLDSKLAHAVRYYSMNKFKSASIPTSDPCLLARIDALLRHKDNRYFTANCKRLIEGYYSNSVENAQAKTNALMRYLCENNYHQFLTSYYSQLYDTWDKETAVKFMVHLHIFDRNTPLNISSVVNVTREKYNYDGTSVVNTLKMDAAQDVKGRDYIYNRHDLDDYPLAALHEYSHIDPELTGRDLAKYHVGTACRINECSIIEVVHEGKTYMFKPFKCYDSYAIMPLLPGERNNRVEAILHHNGQVYVTLVRTFDVDYSEMLIEGNISPQISDLALNYRVNKFDVFFSNDGLCADIACMPSRGQKIDCCKHAFQRNGMHQRRHKQPDVQWNKCSKVNRLLKQKGDKNFSTRLQRQVDS